MKVNLLLRLKKFLNLFAIDENLLHYVNGGDVLPSPYSVEEETELVERLEKGEESVKDMLVEHNLRLVVYIARRFQNTGIEMDDLISVGTIGLIKAVGSFRRTRTSKSRRSRHAVSRTKY